MNADVFLAFPPPGAEVCINYQGFKEKWRTREDSNL
jgi:hypothetical protein